VLKIKLFIDSATLEDIEQARDMGMLNGVTTNPSLIKKAMEGQKIEIKPYIKQILKNCKRHSSFFRSHRQYV